MSRSPSRQDDLARVRAALRQAASVVQRHAGAGEVPYEVKEGHGPVTAADHEADALLRELLPREGDGWLARSRDDLEEAAPHPFGDGGVPALARPGLWAAVVGAACVLMIVVFW